MTDNVKKRIAHERISMVYQAALTELASANEIPADGLTLSEACRIFENVKKDLDRLSKMEAHHVKMIGLY